jgi:nucleotide-binding universal stress UspA family protein
MYEKVLVPLDGSRLAESVLPHVEKLAMSGMLGKTILISVTERVPGYRFVGSEPQEQMIPVAVGKMEEEAQKYLNRIAAGLKEKNIAVETEVLLGNPAEEIAVYAEINNIDLVIMASHGRTGPSRWAHGSVAERVFRAVDMPILMIKIRIAGTGA